MSKHPFQTVVIGAGILGCSTAYRLAAAGRSILLVDRAEPGMGGASYGNAARIATELVEPIPSVRLLLSFWKELFVFGGALDLPLHRIPRFAPWAARFAAAAFKRRANTGALIPIVSAATDSWAALLGEIGHAELLMRSGHYHFWTSGDAGAKAQADARNFESLGIASEPASEEALSVLRGMANGGSVAGLWFPGSAHVVDPVKVCAVLAEAAVALGARFRLAEVGTVMPGRDGAVDIVIGGETLSADETVICAGPQSAAMLEPFGLNAPLEAARGYHIDLPGGADHFGQPAIFMDSHLAMTPLDGRIRASSFLDFVEADAPEDPRKVARLIRDMQALGYDCSDVRSWFGSRSMLPDSLPGIGRARSPHRLYYAIGGQMIGLTIAAGASAMIRNLVLRGEADGAAPFDLSRFG